MRRHGVWLRAFAALALASGVAAAAGTARATAPAFGDPDKVLRVVFVVAETGFDPQAVSDLYSNYVNRALFEPLYQYDYLARPYKVIPNTAAALPEISDDGLTWTIRIKPGIYFTDDPAFKGQRRELTAADYIYSWKRVLDPRTRSPNLQTFDDLFVGADALVANASVDGLFDYDTPIDGLQALDAHTLRIRLKRPSYNLIHDLTTSASTAVAREVIAKYGDASGWVMDHPVGTGPYVLKEWRRGQKIVLAANPAYRDVRFPDSSDPADRAIVKAMHGKRLPQVGRVEINVIEESNPRLQAFERGELDYIALPNDVATSVLTPGGKLKPRFADAGVMLARGVQPSIVYTYFNMEDPLVGGYGRDKVALRRAIGMAYDTEQEIRVLRLGNALPATQPIPPGVSGHDPAFDGRTNYNPAGARALLDKFGYVDRNGDGWRDLPDGKPLVVALAFTPSANERPYLELWQRSLKAVGIRMDVVTQKFPDLLKMSRSGQLMMWTLANTNATTDGYGFLGLLYGGHAGLSNLSRFKLPEFDRLYDQSRALPDGAARTALFRRMSELVTAYSPWILDAYRIENILVYPWVEGYKYNAFNAQPWQYYDVDMKTPHRPVVR
jgi:oligopeptide transport system substrate-binding protein